VAIFWLIFMILAMAAAGVLARYNPDTLVLRLPGQWELHTTVLEIILVSLGIGGGFVYLQQVLRGFQTRKRIRGYAAQLSALQERNQQLLLEAEKHRSEVALIASRLAEIEGRYYLEETGPPPALEDRMKGEENAAERDA
jgi:hypothetical protein